MKNFFNFLAIVGILFLMGWCGVSVSQAEKEKYAKEAKHVVNTFSKAHPLKRIQRMDERGHNWSASFFILGGGASGSSYTEKKVEFCWKSNRGDYVFSTFPYHRTRIKIDEKVKDPYVTFKIIKYRIYGDWASIDAYLDDYCSTITIHCKESDFPTDVDVNKVWDNDKD